MRITDELSRRLFVLADSCILLANKIEGSGTIDLRDMEFFHIDLEKCIVLFENLIESESYTV